jgi:hypothetical protein
MSEPLFIAYSDHLIGLLPAFANRHGLITGATGTGKSVTLQVLAERFSSIGVPVFMADVKGDLSGLAAPGASSPKSGNGFRGSNSMNRNGKPLRLRSGIFTENRATPCGRPYQTWGPCCWAGCSI